MSKDRKVWGAMDSSPEVRGALAEARFCCRLAWPGGGHSFSLGKLSLEGKRARHKESQTCAQGI